MLLSFTVFYFIVVFLNSQENNKFKIEKLFKCRKLLIFLEREGSRYLYLFLGLNS